MFGPSVVIVFVLLLGNLTNGQEGDCGGSCQCREPMTGTLISFTCCLEVEENVPINTFVGTASISPELQTVANNPDAVYSGNVQSDQFRINQTDGNIYTNGDIDRESNECHILVISVGDTTNQAVQRFVVVVTDTNDNSPIFSQGPGPISITIPETTNENPIIDCGAQRDLFLTQLGASDSDDGQNSLISYSIQGSSVLSIPDPNTTLCILNSELLNRDDPLYRPYTFTLIAQDNGNPPNSANVTVIMQLEGLNEFAPTLFPQNSIQVPENSLPGYVVYQFQATDNDSFDNPQEITYTITNAPSEFPFSLNESSGELVLTRTVDAEAKPHTFVFAVQAEDDGGLEGTLQVTLTISDVNEPAEFMLTRVNNISEITISNNVAFFEVIDEDCEQTNNSVEVVSEENIFSIRKLSANIFVLEQRIMVDRENGTPIVVEVRLIERGNPLYNNQTLTLNIHVDDYNDNPPSLKNSSFDFIEEEGDFMEILTLSEHVIDPDEGDNGKISSFILQSAVDSKGIDRTEEFLGANENNADLGPEGVLIAPLIDREVMGDVITINVMIVDSGTPPQSGNETFTLRIIDVNDNPPVFDRIVYDFSLSENMNSSTLVGQVSATDLDKDENGIIRYSFVSDSADFRIDERSGIITPKRSFDRESSDPSMYELQVRAMDQGTPQNVASSMATVRIQILDENDNTPQFTGSTSSFDILTTDSVGTVVGQVMAVDPDDGENAIVEYGFDPLVNNFNISSEGVITLNMPIPAEQAINLTVVASNPGNTNIKSMMMIHINVRAPILTTVQMIIVGCVGGGVLVIVALTTLLICCCCCCKRRRAEYTLKDPKTHLNNHPERVNSITKPILKSVPAATTNGTPGGRERTQVSFSTRVDETHYKPEGAVTDNTKVMRKASITNFGSSDESPQVPIRDSPVHNGIMPSMQVIEYENSPGQHMNGVTDNIPGIHQHFEMHPMSMPQHSPMHMRRDMTDNTDFSQTSSTTDVNDSEEEESTFSDNASNMNTSIPCFPKDDPDLHRYGAPPPPHPSLYPHLHTSHLPSPTLLGIIHPGNMSSLAAPEGSYRSSQGNNYTTRHSQNTDSSSQTTTPSPHPRHIARMDPSGIRPIHSHTNGHNYSSRQLVMPDAFPTAIVPDMHRHVHDHYTSSFSDYGEASTYASIELDEALNCNYEPEPGFYSLTATDYDDHEDT